jgi:hypothetical protein
MAATLTEKIKTVLLLVKEPAVLKALISQRYSGYLKDIGWFETFHIKEPVNRTLDPIPWVTYPFVDFISARLNSSLKVFEFGSGNSTLFYAARTAKVVSLEHNKEWYEKILQKMPSNVNLIFQEVNKEIYPRAATNLDEKFNLIIVDAEMRVGCILNCLDALTDNGVIILDDSERAEYKDGIEFLIKNGFKNLEFWGIAPLVLFKKCTSVFYKENNCLGI